VTRLGDIWLLGQHRLFCGDASMGESYSCLLGAQKADMMFADPPSNAVASDRHRTDSGKVIWRDRLTVEPGELASAEFRAYLARLFGHAARFSIDGAIHFVCADWWRAKEVILAGEESYGRPKDLCVWSKARAGRDAPAELLYIPRHEFIFVFTVGGDAHINNGPLARRGRTRTNVWDYVSQDALDKTATSNPAPRLITKPVVMVADAIRDCSDRGGVVLDPSGQTGTTLIAAERTGRRARVIESDPILVDLAIERWQGLTGSVARHADTGRPFMRPVKADIPSNSE
jgi:DNA modification methylase